MITVGEIADKFNALAPSLAPELLPNGHKSGNFWMASGIADTGQSSSLYVYLAGPKIGHWADTGNCAAEEEHGDMLDLLRLVLRLDAQSALNEAKRRLGIEDRWNPAEARRPDPAERARLAAESRERHAARAAAEERERAAKIRGAQKLFLSGEPLEGTPAELYLRGRGLDHAPFAAWPHVLRFHPEVWCGPERCKLPAMVAAIYNHEGEQIGTHRTFLRQDAKRGWVKIDSPYAKMVLGAMWGGFIPISKGKTGKSMRHMPEGERVFVSEGIENAIVARMEKPEARIVAAISLGNIGGIILPPPPEGSRREIVLICDRDPSEAAQRTFERAIAQQQARGVKVFLAFPPRGINDFNDWLLSIRAETKGKSA